MFTAVILVIAATLTLRLLNPDQYAQNSIVFIAYRMGALISPLSAGQIRDWFDGPSIKDPG